jgi:predicted nucleic acid-binding protein
MRVFVDTSALYAFLDRDDANHKKAKKAWSEYLSKNNVFITTNYVLIESYALIQHRLGMDALRDLQTRFLPLMAVEFIGPDAHRAGVSALLSAARRRLSLVDCISFDTMRTLGISDVLTFDPHFAEQGFRVIP